MGRKGLVAFVLAVVFTIASLPALAQNTRTQENKKAKLEKEIEQINRQLKENTSRSNTALNELTLIRKKISNRNELIAESDQEIAEISARIAQKQHEIEVLEGRLDTLSMYYSKLVRNAYKNRDSKVWYMYILASDNVGQAFRRIGYLRDLSRQMNVQAEKIKATRNEIEEENAKLMAMRTEAQAVRNRRQIEVDALQKEETQSKGLVDRLKRDRRRYENDLASKKKQVEALRKEIERIIREATQGSAKKGSTSKAKPIDYTLDAEFSKNKGKLPWPADGPVVEKYGQHYHPVYTNVKLPFNNGVTISVDKGTAAKAVFDGEVSKIVVMPGYNMCVLVQHGNYFSFYCKLGKVNVKVGDKVKTGDTIGTVDTLDGATQLHFEIWKGTTPQNPETWLR
ncbi:MAG: peptidoglycan DD-metalloendopeptidase family protein [Bacteroidales bacterium]|nr:peptidoglycan DD-metalloendopeptidase family protein [Bacteroidales bacterium]